MNCKTGTLDWDDFERTVTKRTKLIAVGAASNALGTINDIPRAARLARSVGALLFVDAVHYVPITWPMSASGTATFLCAPPTSSTVHTSALLWCRRELLESLPFAKVQPSSNAAPERAETGTLNHEGIAGAAAAVDFLASLSKALTVVTNCKRRMRLSTSARPPSPSRCGADSPRLMALHFMDCRPMQRELRPSRLR